MRQLSGSIRCMTAATGMNPENLKIEKRKSRLPAEYNNCGEFFKL